MAGPSTDLDTKAAPRRTPRTWLAMLAAAVVLCAVAGTALGAVRVVGHSMEPTLGDGDVLLMTRVDYRLRNPRRGDIVIVRDPDDAAREYVKRVVGLPGDRVLIRAGYLYVDGIRLQEPYLLKPWAVTTNWPAFPTSPEGETVPPDSYFVLGDNRDNSGDSRLFGYIAAQQIIGRAVARLWPPDRGGPLQCGVSHRIRPRSPSGSWRRRRRVR